jgi:hypothetical protein
VVRATFPATKMSSYTNLMNLRTSLSRNLRGAKGKRKKGKMKKVREMGAPSSYLTRLLHNHNFAL